MSKQGNLYCVYKCANLILKSYYYFDSEAILLTFELIVIVSLKPLSVSVRCMSHYIIITIVITVERLHCHRL